MRGIICFSDVQVRGVYPSFMSYYLKSNQIKLIIKEEDLSTLKDNTVDFVSFSYYSSACSSARAEGLEKSKANGPETIKIHIFQNQIVYGKTTL